jgi:hypothetical protein
MVLLASRGLGHVVPVPPSTCAFEPVEIDVPAMGISTQAVAPDPSEQLRLLYDPQAGQAQFDARALAPRRFDAAGSAGTLSVPAFFVASLQDSGDFAAQETVTLTLDGMSAAVPMVLTTGLAAAGSLVVEGAPIAPKPSGVFTLVGVAANGGLGPPVGDAAVAIRLTCVADPRPDVDQFIIATRSTLVSASLTSQQLRLRTIFAPGPTQTPSFADRPAIFRVSTAGGTVLAGQLPSGLPAQNRKLFSGRSTDGTVLVAVRLLRRRPSPTYLLGIKASGPSLPAAAGGGTTVTITYDVGGLLSRVTHTLRANRKGTRLHFP